MEKQKTKFKRRVTAVVFFLITALFLTPVSGYSDVTLDEQVAAAVTGGQQFLFNNFHDDGDTGYYNYLNHSYANNLNGTAAAVAALIETGKYRDPLYKAQIDKAIELIKDYKRETGGIYDNNDTYENGLSLVALSLYHSVNPQDPVFIDTYIQPAVDYLLNGQNANGGWGYEADDSWTDLSNTQFAVMGLWYAYHYVLDEPLPADVEASIENFVRASQSATGVFQYAPTSSSFQGAPMTGAGLWCLAMLNTDKSDPAVDDALNWFGDNYTWTETAGYGNFQAYYYGIYGMTKGLTGLIPADYKFSNQENDWVTDLKQAMMGMKTDRVATDDREADCYWYKGEWLDPSAIMSTSWVLMSLGFADPSTESTKKILPDTAEPDYPIQKKGFVTLEATDGVTISGAIHGNNGRATMGNPVRLPIGSFDFTLNNVPVGGEAILKIIPPKDALDPDNPDSFINADGTIKDGLSWFKIRNGEWRGQGDVPMRLMPEGGPYTYIEVTLMDGGPEDEDGVKNGQIQDPAAPGVGSTPSHNSDICFISAISLW